MSLATRVRPLRLAAAAAVVVILLSLAIPAIASAEGTTRIVGYVYSDTGAPLSGITVSCTLDAFPYSATTDESGVYIIDMGPGVSGDVTDLQFSDPEGKYVTAYGPPFTLVQDQDNFAEYPYLSRVPSTRLAGWVYDEYGNPLQNISVNYYWGEEAAGVSTDASGYYEIDFGPGASVFINNLEFVDPTGTYAPQSYAYGDLPQDQQSEYSVALAEAASATGRVIDTEADPIQGVSVIAYRYDYMGDDGEGQPIWDYVEVGSAGTNADGVYTIVGLAPNQYYLRFVDFNESPRFIEEYYENSADIYNATPLDLYGATTVPDVTLEQAAFIEGGVGFAEAPMPGGHVQAFLRKQYSDYTEWQVGPVAEVDSESGYYQVRTAPGTYRLMAYDDMRDYVPQFYSGLDTQGTEDMWSINESANWWNAAPVRAVGGVTNEGIGFTLAAAGHVSGQVTRQSDGSPLTNVRVEAFKKVDGSLEPVSMYRGGYTDADGYYRLDTMQSGKLVLRFTHFPEAENEDDPIPPALSGCYYSSQFTEETAEEVQVDPGELLPNVNQALYAKGSIKGKVTNSSGTAIAGVQVTACPQGQLNEWDYGNATTDRYGNFTIPDLTLGDYKLRFFQETSSYASEWYGDKTTEDEATAVSLTTAVPTKIGANAVLSTSGKVSGYVTDSKGTPVAGVYVFGFQSQGDWMGEDRVGVTTTDATGRYTVNGFASGYGKIVVDGDYGNCQQYYGGVPGGGWAEAVHVPVSAGKTTYGTNVTVTKGGTISGRVKNESGVYLDSSAQLWRKTGSEWQSCDWTDCDGGSYSFSGVAPGTYAVQFEAWDYTPEFNGGAYTIAGATPFTMTAGLVKTGVDAVLGAGGSISGAVTDANYSPTLAPSVIAYSEDTGLEYSTYVAEDHTYTLRSLPQGDYKVAYFDAADGLNPGGVPGFYEEGTDYTDATTVHVNGGDVASGIDGAIYPAGHTVSCVFSNIETGDPVKGSVSLEAVDRSGAERVFSRWLTGDTGYFNLNNVPTGDYKLSFYPEESGLAAYHYPGVPASAAATITIDGDRAFDLEVASSTAIDGKITGVGGAGIGPNRAKLHLWFEGAESGWEEVYSGYASGTTGDFSLKDLLPGLYRVRVSDEFAAYADTEYASTVDVSAGSAWITIPMASAHLGTTKTRLTVAASSPVPSYGGSSVIYADLADVNGWGFSSKTVKLYSAASSSGPWTYKTSKTTTTNGLTAGYTVKPTTLTYYKAVYTGSDGKTKTAICSVKPKVYLTLAAPSTAKRNVAFSIGGSLKPRHTAGSSAVKVECYLYTGGKYVLKKTTYGKASNYSSYSKWAAKPSLAYKGKWKIVATHSDRGHSLSTAKVDYVTVN